MKIALIGLPLVGQKRDPFGSIPAMPTALPALAATAQRAGADVQVIDGFAEGADQRYSPAPGLVARGLSPEEIALRVDRDVDLIGLSVHSVAGDTIGRRTLKQVRSRFAQARVVVGGAHPSLMPERFLDCGADWVVSGEGEVELADLISGAQPTSGVIQGRAVQQLDDIPTPAFELLPLQRYWETGLGHGPVRGASLTISTSRGCSQGCRFCATPALVRGRWRGLSPHRVVELLDELQRRHGVNEFHIEDDDFSASRLRVQEICQLILSRGMKLRLSLPSGVRAASLDRETIRLLAAAGCHYISLAPESGARRVLRSMAKEVDLDHLAAMAEEAVARGMRVGCFFVVGFPGERREDRRDTAFLIDSLVARGVDDLSIFIWSPLPGAAVSDLERGWQRLEELCWTPRWRARYGLYEGARFGLYLRALSAMVRARPASVAASVGRIISGRFETKGEMTINRMLRWHE